MMMYFQRAHDVRMRILSWLLIIHWGAGGGGCDDYSRRNPQRGALPSLVCPAEQGRYDIHGLES